MIFSRAYKMIFDGKSIIKAEEEKPTKVCAKDIQKKPINKKPKKDNEDRLKIKREKDRFRTKLKRSNETPEQSEARKEKEKFRKFMKRANETEEEKAARREEN